MATKQSVDVVVVGGGIAGSALATVLARRGVEVTVLERQTEYHDRVRGELMQPWGVAEAQRLGLADDFQRAGGVWLTRQIPYDENLPPHVVDAMAGEAPKPSPTFREHSALGIPRPAVRSARRQKPPEFGICVGRVKSR